MRPMNGRTLIMWSLSIALIIISTTLVFARIYVRTFMIRSLGWDDGFAIAAWVFLMGQSACELLATYNGSGRDIWTVPPNELHTYFKLLPTAQLLYFLGTGCIRLSITAFLPRLNRERNFLIMVYTVGAAISLGTIISFFVLLFECKPVEDLWKKDTQGAHCMEPAHEAILMYTHAAFGILFDLLLLCIPISLLYKKMMFSMQTVRVCLIFGVGIFTIFTGVYRLATILTINMAVNTTYHVTYAAVWTNLEAHCGLWVACFPPLLPLFRKAHHKVSESARMITSTTAGTINQTRLSSLMGSLFRKRPGSENKSADSRYARGTISTKDSTIVAGTMASLETTPSRWTSDIRGPCPENGDNLWDRGRWDCEEGIRMTTELRQHSEERNDSYDPHLEEYRDCLQVWDSHALKEGKARKISRG